MWGKLMKQSFKIFMTVAEELSIVKAAKRSFVTQQCVSDHIKRLEEEYGVLLFNRKPHLSLTEAGEVMFQYLRSTKILESNMERTLQEMSAGRKGSFTVGPALPALRLSFLLFFQNITNFFPRSRYPFT